MADCPKCGQHLRLVDWKQNCPHCGVNIPAYGFQEKLMKEADKAEVQHYHFQKKLDRLKFSFIGSKLAILRIITSILPIGPVFLPLAKIKITEGLEPYDGNFSFLTLIKKYNNLTDFNALSSFIKCDSATLFSIISLTLLAMSLILTVTHLVLLTLSCSPKGKSRNLSQGIIILFFTVISLILTIFTIKSETITASVSIGGWLYLLMQIINFVIDYLVFKQGIEIHHKQCYVGGIPIEEYFDMIENGITLENIRKEQYKRLSEKRAERQREFEKSNSEEVQSNG